MTCHAVGAGPEVSRAADAATVLLVGNPNVGKSTLFNALTGSHQEVRNAPGTTVEVHRGRWEATGAGLLDVPGTYSLVARSPDEQVTVDAVAAAPGSPTASGGGPDLVLVLVDATAPGRSLYLLGQVARAGRPVVVAVTMSDVAGPAAPDADRMADVLGVPCVAVDPRRREGLPALASAVRTGLAQPSLVDGITPDAGAPGHPLTAPGRDGRPEERSIERAVEDEVARSEELFDWVEGVLGRVVPGSRPPGTSVSDRLDRVVLHPLAGPLVLLAVLWAVFELAASAAVPLMDGMAALVHGPLTAVARLTLAAAGLGGGWVEGLLVGGVLAGVGTVLTFVPLMALMFLAVALLEDSGYLTRAALVADRVMRAVGLDGRAVLPLVVGFGCNVPALAATRTLPDARHRLVTTLVLPLTTCSARLTVYVLLAGAFFPDHAGTVVFSLYVLSGLLVGLGGLLVRSLLGVRGPATAAPLVLVLPAYQRPTLRTLAVDTSLRVRGFVTRAGTVVVAALTVVWLLMGVPVGGEHPVGEVPVEDSLYAASAQAVAPAFAPAGFDDWRMVSALMTGFVAKEVVVGSLAQTFGVTEDGTDAALTTRLRGALEESSGGHGAAAALAFMVFVLAYTPCVATLAEQRRLVGARWTLGALVVQLALAWTLAVATFQAGRLLW